MNILMLTTHLNAGGITSYLLTLTKELLKNGHQVTIASSGGDAIEELGKSGAQCLILNIQTKSELSPKIYMATGRLVKFVKENEIDLIHAHTRVTQVLGKLMALGTGTTYVSTCHGFFKTRWSRKIFGCWGDAVIAISPQVREHLIRDFSVDPKKCFLIKNGIDLQRFSSVDQDFVNEKRKDWGLSEGNIVIGIIARLSDVKGHSVLIEAFSKVMNEVANVKLLIVGVGKEEEKLKNQVKTLKLEEDVIFEPSSGSSEKFLSMFHIFVMPSLQEGLGLSVMEAQAFGLPVVASRVGGIPALIEDGQTGKLVSPNDSQMLAGEIVHLLNNKEEAGRMGRNARQFIEEECSSEKMYQETIFFYEKAMKGK